MITINGLCHYGPESIWTRGYYGLRSVWPWVIRASLKPIWPQYDISLLQCEPRLCEILHTPKCIKKSYYNGYNIIQDFLGSIYTELKEHISFNTNKLPRLVFDLQTDDLQTAMSSWGVLNVPPRGPTPNIILSVPCFKEKKQ